ncbi:hypothetical protein DL95DRAFT_381170 [Leptodontidium sp. 2 PMI_412]|nr:hypothetical protein DL95DRAFT_381170 [Leptodontidium sp. 2 PMI_412]
MSKVRPSCPCQSLPCSCRINVTGCKRGSSSPLPSWLRLLLAGPSQTQTQPFSFLLAVALAVQTFFLVCCSRLWRSVCLCQLTCLLVSTSFPSAYMLPQSKPS